MCSDYEIARLVLSRPRMVYGETQTLRDVLALLHGVAVGRYPLHGGGFLPGFGDFIRQRFKAPPCATDAILLKQFGDKPVWDACDAVLGLLKEWHETNDEEAVCE